MDMNRSDTMNAEAPVGNGQGAPAWPTYFFGALWAAWVLFLVFMVLAKNRAA